MASLGGIKSELRSIANELESIAAGLAKDFEGIGSEVCAKRIRGFIEECENTQRYLNKVDTSRVIDNRYIVY